MTEPIAPQDAPTPTPAAPAGPPEGDKGFPEGMPLAQMNDAQKAAYWQHYARKHEDTVKAFKGLTPQQATELQSKLESLESERMSADEKALKQARQEAATAASEAAKAEYLPQIQALQVKSIASQIIQGDKLDAFMRIANPAALVGEDGLVDESAVMGTLTAMYGSEPGPRQPQWQNFGQYTPAPPPSKPGSGGAAEAQKRFGSSKPT